MGKAKRERTLKDNEAKAVTRTIRVSPQKLNDVCMLIRGKKVATALADLQFSTRRISETVKKIYIFCMLTDRVVGKTAASAMPYMPESSRS